jgi:hypothetical protein
MNHFQLTDSTGAILTINDEWNGPTLYIGRDNDEGGSFLLNNPDDVALLRRELDELLKKLPYKTEA